MFFWVRIGCGIVFLVAMMLSLPRSLFGSELIAIDALKRTVETITPEFSPKVLEQIVAAAKSPETFYRENASDLEERGYDEPYDGLYLDLLMDEWKEMDKLIAVDWKESVRGVSWSVETISAGAFKGIVDDLDEDTSTHDALCAAEKRLAGRGYALLCIDDGSDSYPIFLVPLAASVTLVRDAAACGITVRSVRDS